MRWSIIDNQPFFNHAYFCSARRIYPCRVTALKIHTMLHSCMPLRGGVSLVQPTGGALIASFKDQSEWVTYHPTPSMLQPWLPTRRTVLLAAVSSCANHVLRPIFPLLIERRPGQRPRQHNFTLPDKDDTNYIPRVLYGVLNH